jgi:hypothetical protein
LSGAINTGVPGITVLASNHAKPGVGFLLRAAIAATGSWPNLRNVLANMSATSGIFESITTRQPLVLMTAKCNPPIRKPSARASQCARGSSQHPVPTRDEDRLRTIRAARQACSNY